MSSASAFSLFLLSFLPLVLFGGIAVLNAFTFPRLKPYSHDRTPASSWPSLSVLIPMRNEATVIAETVRSLLAQDYPDLEILLLDDESEDESAQIARQAAGGDPRLRLLRGKPLPSGWLGKPWACHQLAEQARGDYLLFTDADVRWQPSALQALVDMARRSRADLLTVWPTQITVTWGERLVVPLMAFAILAYLPVLAVHHLPWPVFAAAMGQCLLFKRSAYQAIGGHAAIRDRVLDDMAFAYAIKRHRLRLRTADANRIIQTRMYRNWAQVRDGFAKNILAGHGNSVFLLILSTVFHWWQFVLPWSLLPACVSASLCPFSSLLAQPFLLPLLLMALGVLTRALTAATSHQRLLDAVLMPLSVFLMTLIALRSIQAHRAGGPQWKGRSIHAGGAQ